MDLGQTRLLSLAEADRAASLISKAVQYEKWWSGRRAAEKSAQAVTVSV
jgi:hypothetical protein